MYIVYVGCDSVSVEDDETLAWMELLMNEAGVAYSVVDMDEIARRGMEIVASGDNFFQDHLCLN